MTFSYQNPLKDMRESNNNIQKLFSDTCDKFVNKKFFKMRFYSKIYEILAWAFCIFPITLGKVDPQQLFDHHNIKN